MAVVFLVLAAVMFSGSFWGPAINGRAVVSLTPTKTAQVIFISSSPTATSAVPTSTPVFSPRNGVLAPDFFLQSVDGKTVELTKSLGKVTLLYFFSTTCEYCHDQSIAIEALYREYHSQGLQVLGIDDGASGDTVALVQGYARQYGMTFPVLFDPTGVLWQQYLLEGYPDAIFLNSDGRISFLVIGTMSRTEMEIQVKDMLR